MASILIRWLILTAAILAAAYLVDGIVVTGLTVRENLVMAARAGVDGHADWTLERVLQTFPRLGERIEQMGAQLSSGEQQMLAIGRALMTNPRLMILDEATEGLAPQVVAEIWRVVASIRSRGIATLIVDRDYRKVAANADWLVVLQKGLAVLEGPARQLRDGGAEALPRPLSRAAPRRGAFSAGGAGRPPGAAGSAR